MIVGRSRVHYDLYSHTTEAAKLRITPPPKSEFRWVTMEWSLACRAYAKEISSGVLFTRKTLPSKLLDLLDPNLEVRCWRHNLVLKGCKTLDLDDATHQSIREALRATIADARPKDSPSLTLQAICKLLEEPDMHYRGKRKGDADSASYYHKLKRAKLAAPELSKFVTTVNKTYRKLTARPGAAPIQRAPKTAPIQKGPPGVTFNKGPRTPPAKTIAELEYASLHVLSSQLGGPDPPHVYSPESRLAALFLLAKLPRSKTVGPRVSADQERRDTPFCAELR